MAVETDRCINRISMGETNTAYGILLLVGARTSDDTKERRHVPSPSQKSNHNINGKIIYFCT